MSSESRKHPRTPIELKVEYRRLNTFFYDYTRNISKGGTFIKTPRPLDVGTEFIFKLAVPQLPEPLTLVGRVRWVVDSDSPDEDGPGMGIQFIYASDDERRQIEATVEALMKEQLGERALAKLMGKA